MDDDASSQYIIGTAALLMLVTVAPGVVAQGSIETDRAVRALVGVIGALVAVCIHWRLRPHGPIRLAQVGWSIVAFVLGSVAGAVVLLTDGATTIHAMVIGFVVSIMIVDAEYASLFLRALAKRLEG